MKHLIDIKDLSKEEIEEIISVANHIIDNEKLYSKKCDGKILATLFFEPSTRTRLSFEAAMLKLGGNVLGFASESSSSTTKGESIADTIQTVGCYADIIVMRHPKEGAHLEGLRKSRVPIINAGDGGRSHPSQTLTDLLTITREKGKIDNLTIGLCGDLKFGRTVHSLISALTRYDNIKLILSSPKELQIPEYVREELIENKIEYIETEDICKYMSDLDVLYMTRIQKERFESEDEYNRLKDSFVLDVKKIENAKKDLCIMHPLPRVNEISVELDDDDRACYFKQVECGKFVRMALILKLLNIC